MEEVQYEKSKKPDKSKKKKAGKKQPKLFSDRNCHIQQFTYNELQNVGDA